MPNHVANEIIISGPPVVLKELQEFVSGPDVYGVESLFSLHQITPQPEILNKTEDSSFTMIAIWLVDPDIARIIQSKDQFAGAFGNGPYDFMGKIRGMRRFKEAPEGTREELIEWMRESHPDIMELGKACVSAHISYGYHTLFKWRSDNWGTKWDTYSLNVCEALDGSQLTYSFDTAWSIPEPCIKQLAERFPDLKISHKFFDEAHIFWGSHLYSEGIRTESRVSLPEDKKVIFQEVYGVALEIEEDEECPNQEGE